MYQLSIHKRLWQNNFSTNFANGSIECIATWFSSLLRFLCWHYDQESHSSVGAVSSHELYINWGDDQEYPSHYNRLNPSGQRNLIPTVLRRPVKLSTESWARCLVPWELQFLFLYPHCLPKESKDVVWPTQPPIHLISNSLRLYLLFKFCLPRALWTKWRLWHVYIHIYLYMRLTIC